MLLPYIHDVRQLDSIFLYICGTSGNCEYLSDRYSKVIGIFSQSDSLLESVEANMKLAIQQSESFKFYNQNQKSTRNLSLESAAFLWLKVFRDIFVEMPLDKYAKSDMICKLREFYHNNNKQLKLIDEFDRDYQATDALRWYTSQPFIYKLINRALRTEDIEQLHQFRFFVAHLCARLIEEHQYMKEFVEKITLYRGLTMSTEEFDNLRGNVGKLISTNGFLSTSRSKDIANVFAGIPEAGTQTVIFEIECDVEQLQDTIVFADIARFSQHPAEKEVLFDLGATFEILSVHEYQTGSWLVKLKASDYGERLTRDYLECNRQELNGESSALAYASLLARIGRHVEALTFYQKLLDNHCDEDEARIRFGIGAIYSTTRDFDKALKYLTQAYKLMINDDPQRVEESTVVLNSLGNLCTSRGEYGKAIIHFLEALMNRRRLLGDDLFDTDAAIMCNIATVYVLEGQDYDFALKYYKKALQIQKTLYSPNHETIAFVLHNIGNCYLKTKDFDQALKYFEDSLTMAKQILPPGHINFALTLTSIGGVYNAMGRFAESLRCCLQSLEMYEKIYPNGHPDTSKCLSTIGHAYSGTCNHDEALHYFEKALEINEEFLPIIHGDIAGNLVNIANTLTKQNKQEEALMYRLMCLRIEEHLSPKGSLTVINTLNDIAEIYFHQGRYPEAIAYNLKELLIIKYCFHGGKDTIRTANLFCNIGMAFMGKGNMDLSLAYHARALFLRKEFYPNGHVSVCTSLAQVANIYQLLTQYIPALEYYDKALIMYQKLIPDTFQINHNVGEIYYNISNIHITTNNLNLAREYSDKALEVFHITAQGNNIARIAVETQSKEIEQLMKQ